MTTHIDQAITEVIPAPEAATEAEGGDERWHTQERILRAVTRQQRQHRRLWAEGLDD